MALHTTLPIHKTAYELFGAIVDLVRNMPRDIKQSLGTVMRDQAMQILLLVGKANAAADKVPHITQLLEHREAVELMLRTCLDKRFISRAQWARAVELTDSIGKQAGGWRKQSTLEAAAVPTAPSQGNLFSAAPAA